MEDSDDETVEALEVRFQWSPADIKATARFVRELAPRKRGMALRAVAVLVLFVAAFMAPKAFMPDLSFLEIGMWASAGAFVAFLTHRLAIDTIDAIDVMRAEKDYRRVEWTSITIGREGVFLRNETRDEFISWFGVRAIHDNPALIYFEHGELMGIAVPSKGFPTPDDRATFLSAAREFYEQRSENLPQTPGPAPQERHAPRTARLN